MPVNRLVIEVMLATGLRVGDVLELKTEQVRRGRFTVVEQKTGKHRRVYIPEKLRESVLQVSGKLYCFPHRDDWKRHRTRQAVWLDVKQAARYFARTGAVAGNIGTHSARKVYAVERYRATGSLEKTAQSLNHEAAHLATTMLYCMSDRMTPAELQKLAGKGKR